ncbi:hypothetical protein ACH5RR_013088 [Cinchona calisaya]|uniref:Uncharacterized protein n=1 Tax=Cinchona calisaya TaxID=153742 RepID=A0ABD2ZZ34_9GENT
MNNNDSLDNSVENATGESVQGSQNLATQNLNVDVAVIQKHFIAGSAVAREIVFNTAVAPGRAVSATAAQVDSIGPSISMAAISYPSMVLVSILVVPLNGNSIMTPRAIIYLLVQIMVK